ncbi:molybdate ABC transporter permease subunit [Adlercreutzia equolifaciens]|uniref:molybdate ABC transporter permease subunit n=1 Tax=Adlercreutzia equolifaciens TaxID=446660 RepID=UPI0023AEAB0F|nr:molybdate ABC transporter permease subunit [Adlercreutzia equolifaciens]MDE8703460.1 molybdate ABC transporter permease subunit [Adlercreutzia equolifaciens]
METKGLKQKGAWRFTLGARAIGAALLVAAIVLLAGHGVAERAFAASAEAQPVSAEELDLAALAESGEVDVSADGDAARLSTAPWAVEGFSRSQTGSNRAIDDVYYGYTYRVDSPDMAMVVNTADYAVVYVPEGLCSSLGIDLEAMGDRQQLLSMILPLDQGLSKGSATLERQQTWYFTQQSSLTIGDVSYEFGRELKEGYFYVVIAGATEDVDVKATVQPAQMDSFLLVDAESAVIAEAGTPLEQMGEFLATMDYSPLWVTLKTCGVAIVFVFFLGLAAAYFTMRISKRAQDVFDTVFTIPMVLPPTVCGFLLLMLLGRNTAFGQFFQEIGFPLVFSWQATVIAAVVVAFPLMYRSARGAFESLDPNMLDAARTLGWSNARIFRKLMLPLAWSSIASGTVLAFARALGEFGCTLFLAGNQLGSTRTIPIAIYFEWMNGNQAATWFWTIVLIIFSFLVILFINVWSRHTTRYREKAPRSDGRSPKPRRHGRHGGGRQEGSSDGLERAELAAMGASAEGGAR